MRLFKYLLPTVLLMSLSCSTEKNDNSQEAPPNAFSGAPGEVKLITLDPGHFHAALVQKNMYAQVDSVVYVYAPAGEDLQLHLNRIEQFNSRADNPTNWVEKIYTGEDFFEKMIQEKRGNVVVMSGNNALKTNYILGAIKAGLNVLADKPMVIRPQGLSQLQEAYRLAEEKGLLLYDIMTERFEITTILQKELSQMPELFGDLEMGSPDRPAISKESVHHFAKQVSGQPLIRPPWFFDTDQQGSGIVDVSTHLVDLILWECFPEEGILPSETEVISARQWPTILTPAQFHQVTGLNQFPEYLKKDLKQDSILNVYSNGEFVFSTRGIYGKVSVIWNFQAPEGAADTHFSVMRGTMAELTIRQGEEQGFRPALYITPTEKADMGRFQSTLEESVSKLNQLYPGLTIKETSLGWQLVVPPRYSVGHEAHFTQVTEQYLRYLVEGKLPAWELQNTLTKYAVTTKAFEKSGRN